MKNININEVVLSKDIIKERVEFFKRNIVFKNRIPNFKIIYRDILLNSIIQCKSGYNNIKNVYDISLDILEELNVDVDYDKAFDEMYTINEKEIKGLPNTYLIDNSITGILVKLA